MNRNQYIKRDIYLDKLILRRDNGEVKIITGPRRCGKSWLLSHIYRDYLLENGVKKENIVSIDFDKDDDRHNFDVLDYNAVKEYIYSQIKSEDENYYVFLDEIQELDNFERLVNGLNGYGNIDVYVTGSNSRFLSKDIRTIFRGRGDEIRVFPLSFREFSQIYDNINEAWKQYSTFGGMPRLLHYTDNEQKINYLQKLWDKTYLDDVIERNNIKNDLAISLLATALCSSIGSLTNPTRIANTLESVQKMKIDSKTVASYIGYLENAFLFESAERYDVKGNRYFESTKKYYCIDIGLRNSRLNFRQQEPTHIMENILYNHLRVLGFLVDVGIVESREMNDGKLKFIQREIDFVVNKGDRKYYIQSAYSIPSEEKREQELASLLKVSDSFKKIVVVGDDIMPYTDDNGIYFTGLFDFLLKDDWQ
ncbi:MAG: ATP-binding protein [Paramuribaculum sp.]|nr:ATP-binding protein [Paramuribaculum sp.]MDE6304298.1 ATP-binding protein [Paramuribaculum sp.]